MEQVIQLLLIIFLILASLLVGGLLLIEVLEGFAIIRDRIREIVEHRYK